MRGFTRTIRFLALLVVLISTLFASSAFAAHGITASGERYSDAKGNDSKTVSVEFRNIPAEYEGWQATTNEALPVCGVVTNGVVSCEFRNDGLVSGAWLILIKKDTNQVASFYVSFHVDGKKEPKEIVKPVEEPKQEEPKPCEFNPNSNEQCTGECCPQ
jgi:hypothetical protein